MNKILISVLLGSIVFASDYGYNGSTTSVVTLIGGTIKAKHVDQEKKYPRKKCPVCKGTGKYLSGDGIKMVDCGYCEPETNRVSGLTVPQHNEKKCDNKNCKCQDCKCKNCGC